MAAHGSQGNSVFSDWFDPKEDEYKEVRCPQHCDEGKIYEYPGAKAEECEMCEGKGVIDVLIEV